MLSYLMELFFVEQRAKNQDTKDTKKKESKTRQVIYSIYVSRKCRKD